jgi:hypothetical protein
MRIAVSDDIGKTSLGFAEQERTCNENSDGYADAVSKPS